jgi:Fe-S cluster assembly iron-binding protein IscA
MLEVTPAAAEAINAATAAKGVSDTGGLRISVDSTTEQGAMLNSAIAAQPAEGDQVITSEDGPQVFLEPDAALYLTDKVLDVDQDADGQRYLSLHGRV